MTVRAQCILALTGLLAAGAAMAQETQPDGAPADWSEPVADSQIYTFFQGDRLEYNSNEGKDLLIWDAQGWIGGDYNKLWIKSEGEYQVEDEITEAAELQVLYSHTISPFFYAQVGVRHDFKPDPTRSFGVIGIQGLAPGWFEVNAAAFVSNDGDVSLRTEAEYDVYITQRLVLQPRAELNFAVQDVKRLGIGSGLSAAELGLRLRYEIRREFAPYIGVSWERLIGKTADFAREEGGNISSVSAVAGIRLWF
tara:strand:- start:204 stop:959 length:756 start_codon:yes stop_codon:yes gene_type:complete